MATMARSVEAEGQKSSHKYHAVASVLSGHLRRPVDQEIYRQAPVELNDLRGGHFFQRAHNYSLEGLISFTSGYTRVSGNRSLKNHGWVTVATSVVEGLNVADVITVDRLVTQTQRDRDLARRARMLDPDPPAVIAIRVTAEQRVATGVDGEVQSAGGAQPRGRAGDRPALDEPRGIHRVGAAMGGFQHIVGWPDRPPIGPFGPYTDFVAPRLALVVLLAAMEERERTGRGCYIDVSQVETGVWFLSPQIAAFVADATVQARCGNRDAVYVPHGVFPCQSDGPGRADQVAIVARDDAEFAALTDVMGRPELSADARYATRPARRHHETELEGLIAGWTSTRRASEIEDALQAVGVPVHRASTSTDFASRTLMKACTTWNFKVRSLSVTVCAAIWGLSFATTTRFSRLPPFSTV